MNTQHSDQAKVDQIDTETVIRSLHNRITDLEAENRSARQTISQLSAKLRTLKDAFNAITGRQ